MKKLLQFGAGKIGRSFIAQVFSKAEYEIIFVDIDPCVVKSINESGSYDVIIKSDEKEEKYTVDHISAIDVTATRKVIKAIIETDIISISVGKKSLLKLARILARGIKNRYTEVPGTPVDIILAENVRDAASLLSAEIARRIPDVPVKSYVGFVETSIGKMVPLMTEEQMQQDPLSVFAEPYNDLIVDAKAFRAGIPDVGSLDPKENMKAWVDRKIFIHNLGHAVLAYHSNALYPEIKTTWEALDRQNLFEITRATMLQSARVLQQLYPAEFTMEELSDHIDDLLQRFANRALGDTIYRVGCDISRKLARDDRLMIPVEKAITTGLDHDLILRAWARGCSFNAVDDQGKQFPEDRKFKQRYKGDPIRILREHCHFDPAKDRSLFEKVQSIIENTDQHGTSEDY